MKFDFDYEKCSDVGLIVKYGNSNNVVFFYDQIEEAAGYRLELFRLEFDMKQNGFLQPADIKLNKGTMGYYGGKPELYEYEYVTNLPAFLPGYKENELIGMREWQESDYHSRRINRTEITRYPFSKVKPICTLEIERNVFYASVSFLSEGDYICILKAEDRAGNEIAASRPYYFKVFSNREFNAQLAAGIQASVRSAGKGHVHN